MNTFSTASVGLSFYYLDLLYGWLHVSSNTVTFIFLCVPSGKWWMPGLLNVSTPSSLQLPKKILHNSEFTSPPQSSAISLPPLSSHRLLPSWTTAVPPQPRSPAQLLGRPLAKSLRQSLIGRSDPSWSKTLRAPSRSWATLSERLFLSWALWWARVGSLVKVILGVTAAPGCWSWLRKCLAIWMCPLSVIRSSCTSMSWLLLIATHCFW